MTNTTTTAICNIAKRISRCNTIYPWLGEAMLDSLLLPLGNNVINLSYVYSDLQKMIVNNLDFSLEFPDNKVSKEVRKGIGSFIQYTDKQLCEYETMFGPNKTAIFPSSHDDLLAEIGARVMLIKTFSSALIEKSMTGLGKVDIVAVLNKEYNEYRTSPDWFFRS
jgi:hypothetical protein